MRTIFEFSPENAKIVDWLAERGEFELPVPILELPDDSSWWGFRTAGQAVENATSLEPANFRRRTGLETSSLLKQASGVRTRAAHRNGTPII
jgi:hypothetical protein